MESRTLTLYKWFVSFSESEAFNSITFLSPYIPKRYNLIGHGEKKKLLQEIKNSGAFCCSIITLPGRISYKTTFNRIFSFFSWVTFTSLSTGRRRNNSWYSGLLRHIEQADIEGQIYSLSSCSIMWGGAFVHSTLIFKNVSYHVPLSNERKKLGEYQCSWITWQCKNYQHIWNYSYMQNFRLYSLLFSMNSTHVCQAHTVITSLE